MKPRVGISACLLGRNVRYDGDHRRNAYVVEELGRLFEWVPVCPEVEAGFGVPREIVQLERDAENPVLIRMLTVDTRRNLTQRMRAWAALRAQELVAEGISGFVLKRGSPSCGLIGVKVYPPHGSPPAPELVGVGLFVQALREHLPGLPLIDEEMLREHGDEFIAAGRGF